MQTLSLANISVIRQMLKPVPRRSIGLIFVDSQQENTPYAPARISESFTEVKFKNWLQLQELEAYANPLGFVPSTQWIHAWGVITLPDPRKILDALGKQFDMIDMQMPGQWQSTQASNNEYYIFSVRSKDGLIGLDISLKRPQGHDGPLA